MKIFVTFDFSKLEFYGICIENEFTYSRTIESIHSKDVGMHIIDVLPGMQTSHGKCLLHLSPLSFYVFTLFLPLLYLDDFVLSEFSVVLRMREFIRLLCSRSFSPVEFSRCPCMGLNTRRARFRYVLLHIHVHTQWKIVTLYA